MDLRCGYDTNFRDLSELLTQGVLNEENPNCHIMQNKKNILHELIVQQKEKQNQLYQFRMTKSMKDQIFFVLKKRNLDLAHVLRMHIQSILLEERERDANTNDL
jgi:hypothetical protein